MHNEEEYIKDLYSKKFENFEVKTSDDQWLKLNSKLRRKNFMRFGISTINIFYLTIFFVFAGSTVYFGINNQHLSKRILDLENDANSVGLKDSLSPKLEEEVKVIDTVSIESLHADTISNQKHKVKTVKKNVSKPEFVKDTMKNVLYPELNDHVKDSSFNKGSDTTHVRIPAKPVVKHVKKTVLVKQNKVVIKDTVVIKRSSK